MEGLLTLPLFEPQGEGERGGDKRGNRALCLGWGNESWGEGGELEVGEAARLG